MFLFQCPQHLSTDPTNPQPQLGIFEGMNFCVFELLN